MSTLALIQEAEQALENRKSEYLQRYGWHYTSNTPGSLWQWVRDFADEDAKRLAWWEAHQNAPLGPPSKPRAYGIITASTAEAIRHTAAIDTDDQDEEED